MKRMDEGKAAQKFVEELSGGRYPRDRSTNTEVNYKEEKEPRDTAGVKAFVQSKLFEKCKEME